MRTGREEEFDKQSDEYIYILYCPLATGILETLVKYSFHDETKLKSEQFCHLKELYNLL